MADKYSAVENGWFVRRATAALVELLLRPRANRTLKLQTREAQTGRDGVCGLNLQASDMWRFWPKVRRTPRCWEWQGHVAANGYGRFRVQGENRLAHRVSYEFFNGELPEGLVLDHTCANKRCVNPDHLEAVTAAENLRRYREARESAA